jgi:hypothetical protein
MKRLLILFLFACCACSSNSEEDINNRSQDPPVGVDLVFPFEDGLCNEGINPTPTESTVFFEWEPNDNANSYNLTLENLSTGAIQQVSTEEEILPITIARATPFRWYVAYDLNGESKRSAIWNFYNAGPGIETYPPFPADLIAPSMAETMPATTSVMLEWSGSDIDEDIVAYDVYLGTDNPPNLASSDLNTEQLAVSVSPGNIYYWKVVSKDAQGNTSDSVVNQFRVLE